MKKEFALLYKRILPTIFLIACDNSHPNHKLFNSLCFGLIRWLSATKQRESPDVAILLEILMEGISNKDNNNLREFAARALGEFTKWNIKQTSERELRMNHENIKSMMRRIQVFSSHPNPYKRYGALLALRENIVNIQKEGFLV